MLTTFKEKNLIYLFTLRLLSYICIFSLIFPHYLFADKKYYYKFSPHIYNQDEILTERNLRLFSEEEINQKLLKELYRLKDKEFEENCKKKLTDNLDLLTGQLIKSKKGEFVDEVVAVLTRVTGMAPIVGMTIGTAIGGIGSLAGAAVGVTIGVAAGLVLAFVEPFVKKHLNKSIDRQTRSEVIIKEIRDLQKEYRDLKAGLDDELISDYEKRYVQRKRKLANNKPLISEIETTLLEARKSDSSFLTSLNAHFIDLALKLPIRPKPLLDPDDIDGSKEKLIERFERNQVFSRYSPEDKDYLLNVIMQTAVDSQETDIRKIPLRRIYRWEGDPSTGKSTAAREIPQFFGLPYLEMSVRHPSTEFGKPALEGTSRINANGDVGWFSRALLTTTPEDPATYQNGFLIINDLDLDDPSTQSFLLHYADLEFTDFMSPFFNTKVDISRLNIIITYNPKKPSENKNGNSNSSRESQRNQNVIVRAINSRAPIWRFRGLPQESQRDMARENLNKICTLHHVPLFHELTYIDPTKIKVTYTKDTLKRYKLGAPNEPSSLKTSVKRKKEVTPRELSQHILPEAVNKYMINLIKKRKGFFESYKNSLKQTNNNETLQYLKKAASRGHQMALGILNELNTRAVTFNTLTHDHMEQTLTLTDAEKGEVRKWWLKAFHLGSESHLQKMCSYLGQLQANRFTTEDHQLQNSLKEYRGNNTRFTKVIREFLMELGLRLKDNQVTLQNARDCFKHSARLGNWAAVTTLYDLGEKIERDQGLGHADAVSYYEDAAAEDHPMAQFKLGWLHFKKYHDLKGTRGGAATLAKSNLYKAHEFAKKSTEGGCKWGYFLLGQISEENKEWTEAKKNYEVAYALKVPFAADALFSLGTQKKGLINEERLKTYKDEVNTAIKPLLDTLTDKQQKNENVTSSFKTLGLENPFLGFDLEYFLYMWKVRSNPNYTWSKKDGSAWKRRADDIKGGLAKSSTWFQ